MARSIQTLVFALACAATLRAEDTDVKIGSAEQFAAMKVIVNDDSLELRATPGNEAEVTRRKEFFADSIKRWRKAYADRGFVTLPRMQLGIFDDNKDAMRAETINSDLIFVNGALMKEPEGELDSTLCHECFHAVQKSSWKGMEAANELFTKWVDESTAAWMQALQCPESDLVRQRTAYMVPEDFDAPFLGFSSMQHLYRAADFWWFLDELYGAEDLIHQVFMNPKPDGNPPKAAEDHETLLANLLKSRKAKDGKVRSLADVFTEYVVHTYWKKDRGPMVAMLAGKGTPNYRDLLIKNLGKPGELKAPASGRTTQDLPYVEGNDRLRKKVFEKETSERFGIAKQYELVSTMKSDEKGTLKVSAEGDKGMVRVMVFPRGKDGLLDPVIGEVGRPATVEGWEKLSGAIVLLVHVGFDQRRDVRMTAEVKAPSPWTLEVTQQPPSMNSSFSPKALRLKPKDALPEAEVKRLEMQWFAATWEIEGRVFYLYGRFHDGTGYLSAPILIMKPGAYAWRITVNIGDERTVLDGAWNVGPDKEMKETSDGVLKSGLEGIEGLKKRLAEAQEAQKPEIRQDLGSLQNSLARLHYFAGRFEEGSAMGIEALRTLDGNNPDARITLALICRAKGDIEGYLKWCDDPTLKYSDTYRYKYAAEDYVLWRDDLKSAHECLAKHNAEMKAAGLSEETAMFPKLDAKVIR